MKLRLILDESSFLYVCIPKKPEFVEDEMEIWFDSPTEKTCLFKDSYKYVLMVESALVVQYIKKHSETTDLCYPELFFKICLEKSSDRSYENHLFVECFSNTTWLTRTANGDLKLEIWKLDPFSDPNICEKKHSFTIPFSQFEKWWNQLVSIESV